MAQSQQLIVTVPALHPGDKIYFEMSPTTPLHKLFGAYSARQDVPLGPLCWSFAGKVVGGDQTPADIGLADGDQLDAWPAALTRSPPPGGLLDDVLQKLLEFLPVDDVNKAKRYSFCWREMGRFVITHGRWKPVKFVAEHGIQLMFDAARAAQIRLARTPAERDGSSSVHIFSYPPRPCDVSASSLALYGEAWAVDPYATLRILFGPYWDNSSAARFLALVEPSLDGLERIATLCEPAHRFAYATTQLDRLWYGDPRAEISYATIDVIRRWARYIGTPVDRPTLDSLPVERHNLVANYVSGALRTWTDAAVAADFFFCFFSGDDWEANMVDPDLADFTRGWDDGKASALAAAYTADAAADGLIADLRHLPRGPDGLRRVPDDLTEHHIKFAEKVRQVEDFLQLEELIGGRAFARRTTWRTYSSFEEGYLNLVECAASSPGKFLSRLMPK